MFSIQLIMIVDWGSIINNSIDGAFNTHNNPGKWELSLLSFTPKHDNIKRVEAICKNAIENMDIAVTEKEKVGAKRDPHINMMGHICKNQTPESE